jgi:hypothetical protein
VCKIGLIKAESLIGRDGGDGNRLTSKDEDGAGSWSPVIRERRHTLGVSQLYGRRTQMSSLPNEPEEKPLQQAEVLGSSRPVVTRTLSTAGQESSQITLLLISISY